MLCICAVCACGSIVLSFIGSSAIDRLEANENKSCDSEKCNKK